MNELDGRIAFGIEEGLRLIGENRSAGYRAIARGELITYKIGRRRMVSRKALEEYVEAKERESSDRRDAA